MGLNQNTIWEVRPVNGSDTSGGAFNPANGNMATDLAATSGNTSSPVVSSASYSFVAGDVGAWVFIKSGTNWIPGWYQIASVSGGAATLTASIGSAYLYGGGAVLNTAAGCASTTSPTSGTWTIDYSQQNSSQFAYSDLVIGTTNTQLTSSGHPFGKNCVGNILQVTSGTGFTTGWYEVLSVSGTTATMDRAVGTASSTGGNGNLGGALLTLNKPETPRQLSNKVFVKAEGTISATASFAINGTASNPPSQSSPYNRYIGYSSTRGDGGKVTVQLSTNTGLTAINITSVGTSFENFIIDCNNLGTSIGVATTTYCRLENCEIKNFTSKGISNSGTAAIITRCEIHAGTSAAAAAISSTGAQMSVRQCFIHDNACPGIVSSGGSQVPDIIIDNLITNNTGALSDGVQVNNMPVLCEGNTICGSGRDNFRAVNSSAGVCFSFKDNILAKAGAWGANFSGGAGWPADLIYDGNAYWSNASGNRNNMDDGSATSPTNPVNAVAPYVNTLDVICTADPFTNDAGGDFTLNNTAGGGAAIRGKGTPGTVPGATQTGYRDMGVYQHQDSGGGGGLLVHPGMSGRVHA